MDKQTIRNDSLSIATGVGTYYLTKRLGVLTRNAILRPLQIKTPQDKIEPLRKSVNRLIKEEHFADKKIRILDASTPEYIESTQKGFRLYLFSLKRKMVLTKNPIKKLILLNKHKQETLYHKKWLKMLEEGTNGRYINNPEKKQIEVNMKKGIHIFFHEAGHAIDYSKPYLEKLFKNNKNKYLIKLPVLTALITSLTTPENNDNKNNKVNSFIKKYCGVIATIGYLPMMACETSANFRGQLLAKKYAPSNLKILTKTHLFSFISYWTLPVIIGVSVQAANKVRDKITQKLKFSDPMTSKS